MKSTRSDNAQHWQGAVSLDVLLRSRRRGAAGDLIDEDRRRVSVLDDQAEVARMFGKYNLGRSPRRRYQQTGCRRDHIDASSTSSREDGDEVPESARRRHQRRRLVRQRLDHRARSFQLALINLATAFLASSVLGLFEGQLEKMVALAVRRRSSRSQGGNAATQTMTVAVRALATRELGSNNALRVVMREGLVGLGQRACLCRHHGHCRGGLVQDPGLGVVIGLAMVCNLIAGALGGILIPMVLERVRADPAVASGTFVTTITDVVGFFSFLGIATLWFGLQ